jgi:hypothetical protein
MKTISLMLLLALSSSTWACDLCGGVGANASLGLMAGTRFHTFGLQTSCRQFNGYINQITHAKGYLFTEEVTFRWQALPRLQVYGFAPVVQNVYKETFDTQFQQGLGDVRVLVNGIVYSHRDTTGANLSFLSLGYGLKFATGQFAPSQSMYTNLYPGTGSTDQLFLMQGFQRISSSIGIQAEASFALKGANNSGYRFGNSTQASVQLTHNQSIKNKRLLAHAGIVYDHFNSNKTNGILLPEGQNNEGFITSSKMGCMLIGHQFMVSTSFQAPLIQQLNAGQTKLQWSAQLNFQFLIQKKKSQHEK